MKKISIYAFMGAIALTGAVGFSSCSSSSSEEVFNNPDYNPETGMVKTQFAISIPTSSKQSSTRMSADGAPNNGVFKGMKDIKLYPISTATVTSASAITAPITLNNISETGDDSFNAKGSGNNSFNGKVYNDVSIPIGTKAFLFYGEITDEAGGDLTPTYAPVSPATSETANEINFALKAIQDKTFTNISTDEQGAAVLTAVNAIYNSLVTQEATAEGASYAQTTQLNALKQSLEAIHAGSANSVRAFMQNIYNRLTAINTAAAGTYAPAVQTTIGNYFTIGGDSPNNTLTWKTANTFPNNIGLPDGAIGMEYSSTAETKISFKSVLAGGNAQPELNTYVKPASLFYTVNTTIHTSTAAQVSNYADKTTWDQVVALYNSDTQVKGDTRGIVLDNPIQYGVGRLKSQVKLNATLKANDADGTEVAVTVPAGGYTVSGILIGSQRAVGWDFVPKEGATEYTIYDPVQTGGASVKATTTASTANYTLALQTDKDAEVKAVVELVNDGDPFYGYNNQLIPSGSKFYLVGTLNPTAATGVTTYNAEDDHMNRVFCQDVETTVVFTVGETSLKKAYNTIPDLRSAQMELGLSVDLSWTAGLSFDVTF